jgi:hypothetical protein
MSVLMCTINTPYLKFTWPIIESKVCRLVEVSSCIETPVIATMQRYHHFSLLLNSLRKKGNKHLFTCYSRSATGKTTRDQTIKTLIPAFITSKGSKKNSLCRIDSSHFLYSPRNCDLKIINVHNIRFVTIISVKPHVLFDVFLL